MSQPLKARRVLTDSSARDLSAHFQVIAPVTNKEDKMSPSKIVDIADLSERQTFGWFALRLVLVSWLVTFLDGFDMNVIAFAAPYLSTDLHLDKLMLGNVFSSALVGTLIGAFGFGYLGDRFGRQPAIITAVLSFGVLTLALAFARNYETLLALRFLSGISLGGAIPLCWALNIEFDPRRLRATAVTIVMAGYGLGVIAAGPLSIWLIPKFGWPSVFVFGGGASLLSAALLLLWLPESLRFLVLNKARPARIAAVANHIVKGELLSADTEFIVADEAASDKPLRFSGLFEKDLRWITPLLWLAYIFSSISTFFMTTWVRSSMKQSALAEPTLRGSQRSTGSRACRAGLS